MAKSKALTRASAPDTNSQAFSRIMRPNTARSQQDDIAWMLERTLIEMCIAQFKWEGLEDLGVNERWLEMSLHFMALSVFHQVKKPEFGEQYEALRAGPSGTLTRTGDPVAFTIYSANGMPMEEVSAKDCVPIWANNLRIPDYDIVRIYAQRMAIFDRSIEINAMQLRHPKVLKTTTNTSLSIQNLRRQLDEGVAAIELDVSTMDPEDAVSVLDLGIDPDQIINSHIARTRQWAECMTMLGINNSNQDKKERLTAAETAGNDDVIATIREKKLKARRLAADQINTKWGLNISVDYATDMLTAVVKDTDADGDTADPEEVQQNRQKAGAAR